MTDIDFEADGDLVQASGDALAAIGILVQKQLEAEAAVSAAEELLKALKKDLKKIQETDLPAAMDAADTSKHVTKDGTIVEVVEDLTLSLSKNEGKPAAIKWLHEINSDDMVTHVVVVAFGKGKDNERGDFVADLEERKIAFVEEEGLNTASLKALVRRRQKDGEAVPLEAMGGYNWRKAKITLPK